MPGRHLHDLGQEWNPRLLPAEVPEVRLPAVVRGDRPRAERVPAADNPSQSVRAPAVPGGMDDAATWRDTPKGQAYHVGLSVALDENDQLDLVKVRGGFCLA